MHDSTKKIVPAGLAVHPNCPRASKYDPEWVYETGMGWPALWATEALAEKMELTPGMRVLDLGCGKAASSVFLAHEYGVTVWAAELWISPTENYRMIEAQGLSDSVFPMRVDVHAMPFAHEYFDAIISVGAYHYFGSNDYLLTDLVRFLKPEGQLAFVSPAFTTEFDRQTIPEHLRRLYQDDGHGQGWYAFHSPEWWRWHWEKTGLVDIQVADMVPDGWAQWLQYEEMCAGLHGNTAEKALCEDQGRYLGFVRMIARRLRKT